MTLSRAVSDVVAEHTLFEIEAIDRLLLNLYVPTLQHPRALVGYVHAQLGLPIASTAPLAGSLPGSRRPSVRSLPRRVSRWCPW